ncbi:hypothetical protein D3C78_1085190 [compost metagenome]
MQALNDLLAGSHVGRSGKRNARHMRKQFGQLTQLQVLGAEIVTPLRNAVGLVDGEQGNVQAAKEIQHPRLYQALRRQVKHLHFTATQAPSEVTLLFRTEGGVQGSRRDPEFIEGGDLVVHQRDQRRHHHGQARAQQPRYLETQRLAATGGHQHQGIAAIGHAFDDCCLAPTETVVAEDILENALSLFEHVQLHKSPYHPGYRLDEKPAPHTPNA